MKNVLIALVLVLVGCANETVSFTPETYYERVLVYCMERNEALASGEIGGPQCGAENPDCVEVAEHSRDWYREESANAEAMGCKAELDEGLECRLALCLDYDADEACMAGYNACLDE